MRHLVRAVAAIGLALSTRRDLLLEILALRHQLRVLVRSNRRFRPSDRLLWLVLRRSWPRWRDALVLVQPATVDRWHRDGLHGCWRRRSRRPGRPRIESEWRALIRRLAQENFLWGAPRIHGELLKLGIVVSERTVSRYLRGLPRGPSQTWRTFLVNHLAQFTSMSPEISPYASGGDDVVDVSGLTSRHTPLLRDGAVASHPRAIADWHASLQRDSLGEYIVQDHRDDRIVIRNGSSRDPPTHGRLRTTCGMCPESQLVPVHWTSGTTASDHWSRADGRPPFVNAIEDARLRSGSVHVRVSDSHRGRQIREAQPRRDWNARAAAEGALFLGSLGFVLLPNAMFLPIALGDGTWLAGFTGRVWLWSYSSVAGILLTALGAVAIARGILLSGSPYRPAPLVDRGL